MDTLISDWTKLGSVIRDARKARGFSQHALAARAAVSRSWLARLETGHRGAELEPLFRLLEALGMSLALHDPDRSEGGQFLGDTIVSNEERQNCGKPSESAGDAELADVDAGRRAQAAPALAAVAKHQVSAAGRRQSWQDASAYRARSDVQDTIRSAARRREDMQRASGSRPQSPTDDHVDADPPSGLDTTGEAKGGRGYE